jgi:hypothetical protein
MVKSLRLRALVPYALALGPHCEAPPMARRGARRKPTKTLHPKPRPKKVWLHLAPQLTRREIQKLQERAAADMRSIGVMWRSW